MVNPFLIIQLHEKRNNSEKQTTHISKDVYFMVNFTHKIFFFRFMWKNNKIGKQ
jgi:hypothetical protein